MGIITQQRRYIRWTPCGQIYLSKRKRINHTTRNWLRKICGFHRYYFLLFVGQLMVVVGWTFSFNITSNGALRVLLAPDICQIKWDIYSASCTRWNASALLKRAQSASRLCGQNRASWESPATWWLACRPAAHITSSCPVDFELF